jgi:hypothetical protein
MQTKILTTNELSTWKQYFEQLPETGAYHSPLYLDILEGNFEYPDEESRLFILEDGTDFVYYPYFRRPLATTAHETGEYDCSGLYDIVSSWYYGGPLLSDRDRSDLATEFASAFSNHCLRTGIVAEFIRFDPNIRNDERFSGLDPEFNRETVPVDLKKSLDAIWDDFSSSNRTHIRTARDAGFTVSQATTRSEVAGFYDIYSNAMEAKNASDHYWFSLDFFIDLILETPRIATLLLSVYEEDIVGGSLLVHHDSTVNEAFRASDPDLWDQGLNNHLCHGAIKHMYERDFARLDFQGGRPGVFQFKKAFSSDRGKFHIARRIHDKETYDELVAAAAEADIDTDADYFPAYRQAQS